MNNAYAHIYSLASIYLLSALKGLNNAADHLDTFSPVPIAIRAVCIQRRVAHQSLDVDLIEVMLPELGSESIPKIFGS